VDDFGIKYYNENDKKHLLEALKQFYEVSVDNGGRNYCGLALNWNYEAGYVDIAMPGYIENLLKRLQHPTPSKAQYAPHRWTVPTYGARLQMAPEKDTSDPLDSIGIRKVQSIVGSLLYYARAIDSTILPALNDIGAQQSKATKDTLKRCNMLLDYGATVRNRFRSRILSGP